MMLSENKLGPVVSADRRPAPAADWLTPVVLTIDTEPDDAWCNHRDDSTANIVALERLQELLSEFGAVATLLVTTKVARDPASVAILNRLQERHGAEIGAHLHPWESPPYLPSGLDVKYASFPHELPADLFEAKLANLTSLLESRFGPPRSYRAGRWGMASSHVSILERHGYRIDTSVMPLTDWSATIGIPRSLGGVGGADFRLAPMHPYHPSYADINAIGTARLLEIPVTVSFTRRAPSIVQDVYPRLPALARRGLSWSRILATVAATPAEETRRRLLRVLELVQHDAATVINWTIHSSELMLDKSPNTRTPEQLDAVFGRIRDMLAHLQAARRFRFTTLAQAAAVWIASGAGESASGARSKIGGAGAPVPRRVEIEERPEQHGDRARMGYVLAASHSGSTLLAMLLGAHADICTNGELKFTNLGDIAKYRCSCGEPIRTCPFWLSVRDAMSCRGYEFSLENAGTDYRSVHGWFAGRVLRPLHNGPFLEHVRDTALRLSGHWRRAYPEIQSRNAALVRSLLEVSGKSVVVDSSKVALRLKYLLRNPELDVRVVRTIRDGRAVVLTYVDPFNFADATDPNRRGGGTGQTYRPHAMSVEGAAYLWRRSNEEAEAALAQVSPERVIRVRYEALCADPMAVLGRVFNFLGVDPARGTLDFRSVGQHVIGNGMRHDTTSEIRLDERWKSVLTDKDLKTFDRVAGVWNRRFGYQ